MAENVSDASAGKALNHEEVSLEVEHTVQRQEKSCNRRWWLKQQPAGG